MRNPALALLPVLAMCAACTASTGATQASLTATPAVGSRSTSTDEANALAIVQRLNDAMRARDTALIRTTFHSDARLVVTTLTDGRSVVRVVPINTYIASIGGTREALDERLLQPEVHVDDNVSSVWVRYAMYRNGHFSHCGSNAYQLVRTTEGWKIIEMADAQRREACDSAPSE